MSDEPRIITNNVPRDVVNAWEPGEDSASFFRYKGDIYDLGEFTTTWGMPEFSPLRKWDGYIADSFFSGIVIRHVQDCERVIVGRYLA